MKIVHVNLGGPVISVDGIASVVATLADGQREQGDEVRAFTDRDHSARGLVRGVLTALKVRGPLVRSQPDVVHLHSVFRPAHAVLAALLRMHRIPYVVSPHSGLSTGSLERQKLRKAVFVVLLERRMLAQANAVLCLSDVEGHDVTSVAANATIIVVPNPGPPTSGRPDRPDVERGDHLLTLCRFDVEQKGLDRLVEIARAMPATRFCVFGETDVNDPARAGALIEAAPANISFSAPIRGVEKDAVLVSARAYIQPSRWEGQSISVLEALSAGVPCIVSGYIAETLGSELAELTTVIDDDPTSAAVQIAAALADEPAMVECAQRARDIVRSRYSVPKICQELDRAYAAATSHADQQEVHA